MLVEAGTWRLDDGSAIGAGLADVAASTDASFSSELALLAQVHAADSADSVAAQLYGTALILF